MKIRIFALARELNIDSRELIQACWEQGFNIKSSPLVSISPEERDVVLVHLRTKGVGLNSIEQLEQWSNDPDRRSKIVRIDLRNNRLEALPDFIEAFTNVEEIQLGANNFSTVPAPLTALRKLIRVDLSHNNLSELPSWFSRLQNIESVDLSYNRFTMLPPALLESRVMSAIRIGNNSLTQIPASISRLTSLVTLDVRNNDIGELPRSLESMGLLTRLLLHNNNRLKIPAEIIGPDDALSATDAKRILRFVFAPLRAQEKTQLREAKLLLVGQGNVGKTSLSKLLRGATFDVNEAQTDGINIAPLTIRVGAPARHSHKQARSSKTKVVRSERPMAPVTVKLNVWDFGGQEIMHATHQFFLTQRSIYIVVIDARAGEQEGNLHYWLKTIQSLGGNSPVILAINKYEPPHTLELDIPRLKLDYSPNLVGVFYVSCATRVGIVKLLDAIRQLIARLPHVFDELPTVYGDVKKELERLASTKDFISHSEFLSLCEFHGIDDGASQEQLLQFLHDLGSVLHYDDQRQTYQVHDTNVLNPEWVTGGVYKIITNHELRVRGDGKLRHADLSRLFGDLKRYPAERHRFLVDLMRKFDLCFEFSEAPGLLLIPELLSVQEPDVGWTSKECLDLEIHYSVLPRGLMPRFIVRTHHLLSQKRTYWRSGVVLNIEGCRVLIRSDHLANKVFIQVQQRLANSRRLALTVVLDHFRAIHAGMPRLDAKFKVPLPDDKDAPPVDFDFLRRLEDKGVDKYWFEGASREYSVRELLAGIEEPSFDIFLCHNSADKPVVRELSRILRIRGIRPYFDELHLAAGKVFQTAIAEAVVACSCVAVLLGPSGAGQWQLEEVSLSLNEAVAGKKMVIPVLLPGCKPLGELDVPPSLRFLLQRSVVDMSAGIDDLGLERLIEAMAAC